MYSSRRRRKVLTCHRHAATSCRANPPSSFIIPTEQMDDHFLSILVSVTSTAYRKRASRREMEALSYITLSYEHALLFIN